MIKIHGNDIYIDSTKIGIINGNRVYDRADKELGYFTSDSVYDVSGERLAHIEGNYIYSGNKQMKLEDVIGIVEGVGLSNAARAAVSAFFGK